jgi:hypothetical protein
MMLCLPPPAFEQMGRRGITEEQVRHVLAAPETVQSVRSGRIVAQGIVTLGEAPGEYPLRVFVDFDRAPAEIVTIYRTGKVEKYRSLP